MPRLPKGLFRRNGRSGFYFRDQRGGRDRWMKAGATKDEAKAFLDRVRGSTVPVGNLTVAEAARRWVKRKVALDRTEKGARLARQRVERELVPALGLRPVALLTADDCRGYRLTLEERKTRAGTPRSPQTVVHILSDFRAFLLWCVESEILDRSPFPRGLLPRVQERPPDRLTDEEVARLVTLPEPWGFYLRLLVGTGLRWSEATRAEAVHVEREQLLVSHTKSGKMRWIPLEPVLLKEVQRHVGRLVHVAEAESLAVHGRKVVPRFHVHQARHTFGCRWVEAGGSLTMLQEVMGHASIRTTQRYARPNEASIRREAERGWG